MKPGTINLAGHSFAIITDLHQGGTRVSKHDRPGATIWITESFRPPLLPENIMALDLSALEASGETLVTNALNAGAEKVLPSFTSAATKVAATAAVAAVVTFVAALVSDYLNKSKTAAVTPTVPTTPVV